MHNNENSGIILMQLESTAQWKEAENIAYGAIRSDLWKDSL